MRRSRIKAMATVPARRKPIKDAKEESADTTNPVSNEPVDDKQTTETPSLSADNSRETTIETINSLPEKHETEVGLQQPLSISRTVDIAVKNDNDKLVASSEPPESVVKENSIEHKQIPEVEALVKTSKQTENIVETNSDQHKQILEHENPTGSDETKGSSCLDTTPVAKVSQTRTSFMRPTPRLDGGGRIRRNSVQGSGASASESEDDCRRAINVMTNRIRNDSVSSMQSPKGPSRENSCTSVSANPGSTVVTGGAVTASPGKNVMSYTAKQKRKQNVSESARKLAEARREFLLKHEHKQPDRAKLTMYDLIYYNPVTNPIKKSDGPLTATQRNSSVVTSTLEEDEEEDDCEASDAMPVPQVKVGPDGHLVLDEQSLVIEHTGAKKSRQALARTEALIDEDSNGSGFYKKRQKTRDWPNWETLKFYKALNTVGTDFLLMQSLFPRRSRQEIKMKFKKEEKTNRRFVEKALIYHQEFDIESLKEDLATFEECANRQSELAKSEKAAVRQDRVPKRKKNKSRRMVALSIAESNEELDEREASVEETTIESRCQESPVKGEKKRGGRRRPVTNDPWTRSESTSSSNESTSDTEIYQIKPTRSGRKPKIRKLQAPTINTLDNLFSDPELEIERRASPEPPTTDKEQDSLPASSKDEEKIEVSETVCVESNVVSEKSQSIENSVSGITQVKPGSLVIVSRESTDEPGETVLQVYMVSSDIDSPSGNGTRQNMTPVVLTPELLNTVTAGITKVAPINLNKD